MIFSRKNFVEWPFHIPFTRAMNDHVLEFSRFFYELERADNSRKSNKLSRFFSHVLYAQVYSILQEKIYV